MLQWYEYTYKQRVDYTPCFTASHSFNGMNSECKNTKNKHYFLLLAQHYTPDNICNDDHISGTCIEFSGIEMISRVNVFVFVSMCVCMCGNCNKSMVQIMIHLFLLFHFLSILHLLQLFFHSYCVCVCVCVKSGYIALFTNNY